LVVCLVGFVRRLSVKNEGFWLFFGFVRQVLSVFLKSEMKYAACLSGQFCGLPVFPMFSPVLDHRLDAGQQSFQTKVCSTTGYDRAIAREYLKPKMEKD